MKSAIVKLKIQFDLAIGNGTIEDVRRTLNEINGVLQESFPFEQPQLFVGAVSDEDIEIANDERPLRPDRFLWMDMDSSTVFVFSEIRDTFEDEGILHIDAWTTEDDEEEGRTIAKINIQNGAVEYLDERARTDQSAQEIISFHVDEIKKGFV